PANCSPPGRWCLHKLLALLSGLRGGSQERRAHKEVLLDARGRIFSGPHPHPIGGSKGGWKPLGQSWKMVRGSGPAGKALTQPLAGWAERSEERRVGKEWRRR